MAARVVASPESTTQAACAGTPDFFLRMPRPGLGQMSRSEPVMDPLQYVQLRKLLLQRLQSLQQAGVMDLPRPQYVAPARGGAAHSAPGTVVGQ